MPSTVATRPIGESARYDFDNDQIATIRRTIARDFTDSELSVFLELAGRYKLDVFAGELFGAKMGGKDGATGSITFIVGKSGMLKVAQRQEGYEGLSADVVRSNDTFEVSYDADQRDPKVIHSYKRAVPPEERGEIVGAWAKVFRTGRTPAFFWAPWSTYNTGKSVWSKFPEAMIRKCAISNALREQFSLSGLYDESEMGAIGGSTNEPVVEEEPDYGPGAQGEWLKQLFIVANEVMPDAFPQRKIRFTLAGQSPQKKAEIAKTLVAFIEQHGGEVPEMALEGDAEEASE